MKSLNSFEPKFRLFNTKAIVRKQIKMSLERIENVYYLDKCNPKV